jgi:hypothetical protein
VSLPIKEMAGLLSGQGEQTGVVTGFSGDLVVVATERGAVLARPAGTMARGNRVTVRDGWAEPAPVASVTYQV